MVCVLRCRLGAARAPMGMRKFRHGVRAIRRNAGVVGLQEVGANRRRHFLEASDRWGYFRPRYIQQNPVIWDRRRFEKVDARGHRIARSRHLRGQLPGWVRSSDGTRSGPATPRG